MILKGRTEIDTHEYGCEIFAYSIECFDRDLYIVYMQGSAYGNDDLERIVGKLYRDWVNEEEGTYDYCCEEYILEGLPGDFKPTICAVLYNRVDDEETLDE